MSQANAFENDSLDEILAELRTEGVAAWKAREQALASVDVEIKSRYQVPSTNTDSRITKRMLLKPGRYIEENRRPEKDTVNRVVTNDKYIFWVDRFPDKPFSLLDGAFRDGANTDSLEQNAFRVALMKGNVLADIWFQGVPLAEIVESPLYTVTSAKRTTASGEDTRIVLEVSCVNSTRFFKEGDQFSITLSDRPTYGILSGDLSLGDGVTSELRLTYQTSELFGTFPKTLTNTMFRDGKLVDVSTLQYGKPSLCETPDEEFFTAFYSIDEDSLRDRSARPLWLYGVVTAVVLGVGGWLTSRYRPRTTQP